MCKCAVNVIVYPIDLGVLNRQLGGQDGAGRLIKYHFEYALLQLDLVGCDVAIEELGERDANGCLTILKGDAMFAAGEAKVVHFNPQIARPIP